MKTLLLLVPARNGALRCCSSAELLRRPKGAAACGQAPTPYRAGTNPDRRHNQPVVWVRREWRLAQPLLL